MSSSHPTSNTGKKFVRDLGIYAIGNLGSKLITFLLVPFYTFYISDPAEFGYYDICLTVVFCLGPIISLQLSEGGFRFLLEESAKEEETPEVKRAVISYVYSSVFRNALIVIVLGMLIGPWLDLKYWLYVLIYGVVLSFYDVTNQLVRGLGCITAFMTTNIFNSFSIAMLSVLFVAVCGWGVDGIFIANIGARLLSLLWIECKVGLFRRFFSRCYIDKRIGRDLLRYSLPLLPMILIWWVLNSNNIFFIKHYLGVEENGIYAVLGKFTGILFILANIFYQTWQQNAIERFNTPSREDMFNKVFNNYLYLLCVLVSLFPFALRLNYGWLVSKDYYPSAQYLYLNSLFVMGFSIASFYEVPYQCAKRTARILPSIILGVVVNITANFMLVEKFGLYGIVASSVLTYMVIIAYRAVDTRRIVKIRPVARSVAYIVLMLCAGVVFTNFEGLMWDVVAIMAFGLIFLFSAPADLKRPVVNLIRNRKL